MDLCLCSVKTRDSARLSRVAARCILANDQTSWGMQRPSVRAPSSGIILGALLLATAGVGCARSHVESGRPPGIRGAAVLPRGHLLMVGGGPAPREIAQLFVNLAGGAGRARVAVLPMASSVATTGPEKVSELQGLGADAFVVQFERSAADDDSIVRKIESATGIWLSGGDQNRLMAAIGGSRSALAIRNRYAAGAVIGGTSAGAAVMSDVMITGDESRPGGVRPLTDSTQSYVTIDRNNVVTAPGLGLLKGAIVDQHFVRRRRNNRLVSLSLEHPALFGVGIDESTAIHVRPDGSWLVAGASVVVIFDARTSTITAPGTTLGASGIMMQVLPAGSTFDPGTGRVTRLGSGR